MRMMGEFKAFAVRGNVIDMAVGIVIGAAFGKIVSSFVADVLTPPLGLLLGGVDFSEFALTLKAATDEAAAVTLNYGRFIQSVIDFGIIAFAIFLGIRAMNALKDEAEAAPAPPPPPAPPEPTREEALLTEIRDLLKRE